jgi:tetratricopeptide (TPR) repeat protein
VLATLASLVLCAAADALPQQPPDPLAEQQRSEALAHYRRGDEALHSERFAEAEAEFEAAIRLDPLLTLAHYGLGQALMAQRRYPEAVKAYEGCREAFLEIARIGLQDQTELERRRTQAIAELRTSIAMLQRSTSLANQNQNTIRRMEDRVRELERMRPGSEGAFSVPAEVLFSLGSAWFRAGSLEEAERWYEEALEANPRLGEAHSNLAVVCLRANRIEEAWGHIRAAEKAGFRVNPQLKKDVESRRREKR